MRFILGFLATTPHRKEAVWRGDHPHSNRRIDYRSEPAETHALGAQTHSLRCPSNRTRLPSRKVLAPLKWAMDCVEAI